MERLSSVADTNFSGVFNGDSLAQVIEAVRNIIAGTLLVQSSSEGDTEPSLQERITALSAAYSKVDLEYRITGHIFGAMANSDSTCDKASHITSNGTTVTFSSNGFIGGGYIK